MNSQPNTQLLLDIPKEIAFNYIPKKCLPSTLKLTNTQDFPIAYKIKSTAPTHYFLASHTGTIPSNSSTEVTITMQSMDYNPQNASIKDFFLIEAIPLISDLNSSSFSDPSDLKDLWTATPKSQVQSSRLKVVLKYDYSHSSSQTLTSDSKSTVEFDTSKPLEDSVQSSLNSSDFKSLKGSEARNIAGLSSGNNLLMSFANETKGESLAERLIHTDTGFPGDLAQSGTWPGVSKEIEKESPSMKVSEGERQGLERRIEEMSKKMEEQRKLLFEVSEENTRLKSELSNLKSSAFVKEKVTGSGDLNNSSVYQLWHILLAVMFSLILGALLG